MHSVGKPFVAIKTIGHPFGRDTEDSRGGYLLCKGASLRLHPFLELSSTAVDDCPARKNYTHQGKSVTLLPSNSKPERLSPTKSRPFLPSMTRQNLSAVTVSRKQLSASQIEKGIGPSPGCCSAHFWLHLHPVFPEQGKVTIKTTFHC